MINIIYPVLPMLALVSLLGKTTAVTVVGTHNVLETTTVTYGRTFKHPFDGFGNIQRKWFSGTISK